MNTCNSLEPLHPQLAFSQTSSACPVGFGRGFGMRHGMCRAAWRRRSRAPRPPSQGGSTIDRSSAPRIRPTMGFPETLETRVGCMDRRPKPHPNTTNGTAIDAYMGIESTLVTAVSYIHGIQVWTWWPQVDSRQSTLPGTAPWAGWPGPEFRP